MGLLDKDDRLDCRQAIADFLGITSKTLDSWRKIYGPDHPNPLPLGKIGKSLVASKSDLQAWQVMFIRHPEWK